MQIEVRLKKLLHEHNLDRRGVEQLIARDLGVHRHTIGKLYRNQLANPSLKVLGMLCDWLENHGVPSNILPQALLGSRPSGLWEAVGGVGAVTIYLGEYQQGESPAPLMLWIARRDATVESEIVHALSTPSFVGDRRPTVLTEYVPFRFAVHGAQVKRREFLEDLERATRAFRNMRARGGHSAAILIGSQRVNFLVELLVADLFGCAAFPAHNRDIQVPFYLAYRSNDQGPTSCFGSHRNPLGRREAMPGTFFLDAHEQWVYCPWRAKQEDAGVIITVYDPGTKGLEMVVFGFSGRGTEALGRQLLRDADPFWPPSVEHKGKRLGVYVCRFKMSGDQEDDANEDIYARDIQVTPLDAGVLAKYLKGGQ